MKKDPLISIILSTFNNESTIGELLITINNQSYRNYEILVVDEWSKDKTVDIAKKLGAKVFLHGKERSNNRNFGISKAKGDYYCILDSDMQLPRNLIEEAVALCERRNADAVIFPEKSIGSGYWAKVRAFERVYNKGNNNVEAARFFKRSVIKKVGGYDPDIVGAEDWDLQQRVLAAGFTIARTRSLMIHNEGSINLIKLLRKKAYYGKAFLLYKNRYPKAFKSAIIRKELFKHWLIFFKKPKYGLGVFILKFLEGISLFTGMVLARIGKEASHY